MLRSKQKICFGVKRNGVPIRKHYLPGGIKAGLSYNKSYAEAEACISAGLNYHMWRSDGYTQEFKGEVVAWYQMKGLIEAHVKAAEARAMKQKSKKGKKGK